MTALVEVSKILGCAAGLFICSVALLSIVISIVLVISH